MSMTAHVKVFEFPAGSKPGDRPTRSSIYRLVGKNDADVIRLLKEKHRLPGALVTVAPGREQPSERGRARDYAVYIRRG